MDDSKTTFGPSSRFAALPLPRKIGLAIVVVLLGYGLADPAFLSDADMKAAHRVDEDAALQDFLAHIDGRDNFMPVSRATESATETDARISDEPQATAGLSQPASEPVVRNVSYPNSPPADPAASQDATAAAVTAEGGMLIVPRPSREQSESASPRIRLTGTIYPNSL